MNVLRPVSPNPFQTTDQDFSALKETIAPPFIHRIPTAYPQIFTARQTTQLGLVMMMMIIRVNDIFLDSGTLPEGIIPRTVLVMIGKRTLRAPRLSIATIPQQLALTAPGPFVLKSRWFSGVDLKFIISAAGMVVRSALNARAGGWIAPIGKAIALVAPPPIVLAVIRCVVQPKDVETASNTDVGTAGGAVGDAVESEEIALVTPAPLVLPSWWSSVDG